MPKVKTILAPQASAQLPKLPPGLCQEKGSVLDNPSHTKRSICHPPVGLQDVIHKVINKPEICITC